MTSPLFDPQYADPVDTTTQVARMPGTVDAPCLCREPVCAWPFCCPTDEEDDLDAAYLASLSDRCPDCDAPPTMPHRPLCPNYEEDA